MRLNTSARLAPALLAVTIALAICGPAGAATLAVPDQYPTIAAALEAAQAGDFVLVGCGVYRERNLRLKPGVSLWSATLQPDCAVIDAEGRGRVLVFDACDTTTAVVGLTLRGGLTSNDGGAVLCRDAAPRLARCRIEASEARRGGALACFGARGPVLEDCVIVGNSASQSGGGIFWDAAGNSRLTRCVIARNVAGSGGGLAVADAGDLLVENGDFEDNEAGGLGGAIWIAGGTLEVRGSVLARNVGGLGGGAVATLAARARLLGCTVVDNLSDAGGHAIELGRGSLAAERVLVAFNTPAAMGGAGGRTSDLSHCDIYGHPDGDWTGPVAGLATRQSNFSADPRFCQRASGLYDLRAGSPCLPGGRPGVAVLVGARDQGCR